MARVKLSEEERKKRKAESNKRWREANREKIRELSKRSYEAKKTDEEWKARNAEHNKRWHQVNKTNEEWKARKRELNKRWHQAKKTDEEWKARNAEQNKRWREANKDAIAARRKVYYAENRELYRARRAARRARQLRATPLYADMKAIKEIYLRCPEGYHVDHIIPLKNNRVCGLHVEFNLQYLPAAENLSKSNRLDESYL